MSLFHIENGVSNKKHTGSHEENIVKELNILYMKIFYNMIVKFTYKILKLIIKLHNNNKNYI